MPPANEGPCVIQLCWATVRNTPYEIRHTKYAFSCLQTPPPPFPTPKTPPHPATTPPPST
ncbi:MAG: hypothetical protein BRD29_00910 [Bacteroidetes bacterium QH_2_67_10]|nr:MAG: hypothetical protein BRD29_00910 [Bacteroidetes bacterium QH_2_67_10]